MKCLTSFVVVLAVAVTMITVSANEQPELAESKSSSEVLAPADNDPTATKESLKNTSSETMPESQSIKKTESSSSPQESSSNNNEDYTIAEVINPISTSIPAEEDRSKSPELLDTESSEIVITTEKPSASSDSSFDDIFKSSESTIDATTVNPVDNISELILQTLLTSTDLIPISGEEFNSSNEEKDNKNVADVEKTDETVAEKEEEEEKDKPDVSSSPSSVDVDDDTSIGTDNPSTNPNVEFSTDKIEEDSAINNNNNDANVMHVTTEPLTNHMTNEKNVVSEVNDENALDNKNNKNNKNKYEYQVMRDANVSCIMASMAVSIKVPYLVNDKKTLTKTIEMPSTAEVSGNCGLVQSDFTLKWTHSEYHGENSLTFYVAKDKHSFYVKNVHVVVALDEDNFPNAADTMTSGNSATNLKLFSAPIHDGIHVCHSTTDVQCGDIVVTIKDISFVAYNTKQDVSFRREENCAYSKYTSTATVMVSLLGVVIVIGIILVLAWLKNRSNSFRSELP